VLINQKKASFSGNCNKKQCFKQKNEIMKKIKINHFLQKREVPGGLAKKSKNYSY